MSNHGDSSQPSFRTRAIHVGNEIDPTTGAVVPPIHFASTFRQPGAGKWGDFDYSRSGNPTRSNLQTTLASLEGGCGALAFSSGMAAIHCVTMMLSAGDHLVAGCDLYGGAYRLLHKICNRSGIEVTLVDMTDVAAVENAITDKTKLIWGETIGNPRLSIPDLSKLAELGRHRADVDAGRSKRIGSFVGQHSAVVPNGIRPSRDRDRHASLRMTLARLTSGSARP